MTKGQPQRPIPTSEEVDEQMAKLIVLTPFYSIESWTYYNTAVLRTLCEQHEQAKVDGWASNPSQIEEIERIGEQLVDGKKHNQQLAEQQFPSNVAMQVRKSFADAVNRMRASTPLMAALSRIMYSWKSTERDR